MLARKFSHLFDKRLLSRGNKILEDLFHKSVHSIRRITKDEASAKGFYRFLLNERVTESDIIDNLVLNCQESCKNKYVICIQDTTEINLSNHKGRIKKDSGIGTTNAKNDKGLGFFIHPSLVLDAENGTPYGYADIKIWNRPLEFKSKKERDYTSLPIEEKDSYKWIEVSQNTISSLQDIVKAMVIVQDREGDIYEQFITVPQPGVELLVRARADRTLADKTKLFSCLSNQPSQGSYEIVVDAKNGRSKRLAQIEIRYKEVTVCKPGKSDKDLPESVNLWLIEAKETGYSGKDSICWRLLTTIPIENADMARACLEWYSWRWTVEEVFKILKKEGYNIEASELEYACSIRKMSLMIMEVVIKLFLMRLAYAEPELEIDAGSCFDSEEQELLELHIAKLEGKTEKQKNHFKRKDLKRYVWAIARMGGWKGYESKRHPGITTLWLGLKFFRASYEGWCIQKDVSTR